MPQDLLSTESRDGELLSIAARLASLGDHAGRRSIPRSVRAIIRGDTSALLPLRYPRDVEDMGEAV